MTTTLPRGAAQRRGEIGASAVKVIISFVILAIIAQAAYVFIPRYIAVYDLTSQMEKEAQFGGQKSNEAIVKSLLAHAAEQGLVVEKEDIKVERTPSRLTVGATYTVPIPTLLYTYDWQVTTEKSGVLF